MNSEDYKKKIERMRWGVRYRHRKLPHRTADKLPGEFKTRMEANRHAATFLAQYSDERWTWSERGYSTPSGHYLECYNWDPEFVPNHEYFQHQRPGIPQWDHYYRLKKQVEDITTLLIKHFGRDPEDPIGKKLTEEMHWLDVEIAELECFANVHEGQHEPYGPYLEDKPLPY